MIAQAFVVSRSRLYPAVSASYDFCIELSYLLSLEVSCSIDISQELVCSLIHSNLDILVLDELLNPQTMKL